ncbi:MAG: tetratricopeptide repeat protein [Desulfuromonadaceae bacterium]|nr:tetratricopeptide repeat protein [Desulfuromonadaceae bacterium]MDD2855345.1 tetratricopeptide repeat protein [Desulfuromonadaceae bacterium]
MNLSNRKTPTVAFVAVVVCLLVYLPALFCDFVNWDDPLYVIENTGIRLLDLQFIREAFTTSYLGWWMPLTWISFSLDYQIWGLNPFGYHVTNIVLHSLNAGLVVLVADELLNEKLLSVEGGVLSEGIGEFSTINSQLSTNLYPATLLLASLFWALHPLRVESVAWVTERKDVLNGFFSLLAFICYLRFAKLKDVSGYSKPVIINLLLSLFFLLLSLMSKPVSVVIPALFLLADWYPSGRFQSGKIRQILLEKIPFVILVGIVSFLTIYSASGNSILVSYQNIPLSSRFLLAGNSLFEYLKMSVYPVDIVHIYLLPWPFPPSYTLKSIVIAVFILFCLWRYKKNRWLPATLIAFTLPLLPVLGFFQNGAQSHAARFTYLPGIAFSICSAVLLACFYSFAGKSGLRFKQFMAVALTGALLLTYTAITELHIASWKNSETLWSRVIAITPIGRAYYLRADYYLQKGRYIEAADDLLKSIEMGRRAGYTMMYNLHALRADALDKAGRDEDAVCEFTNAINIKPYPNYYYHRGVVLNRLGRVKDAETDFIRAEGHREPIEWQELK